MTSNISDDVNAVVLCVVYLRTIFVPSSHDSQEYIPFIKTLRIILVTETLIFEKCFGGYFI